MNENSCEDETSESAENVLGGKTAKKPEDVSQLESAGVRIGLGREGTLVGGAGPVDAVSEASASGPSTTSPADQPLVEEEEAKDVEEVEESVEQLEPLQAAPETQAEASAADWPVPVGGEPQQEMPVQMRAHAEEETEVRPVTIGPPPSYSFVMKQKQKKKSYKPKLPDPIVTDRPPPPPTYSGNRGLCLPPDDSRLERLCNLPSLSEPLWRSHSQPALCPRCGIIILTTIHSHDSIATHVAALALCLFGCWPCCLLPYCMNVCKNTYHHCPICQSFLGAYTPW